MVFVFRSIPSGRKLSCGLAEGAYFLPLFFVCITGYFVVHPQQSLSTQLDLILAC